MQRTIQVVFGLMLALACGEPALAQRSTTPSPQVTPGGAAPVRPVPRTRTPVDAPIQIAPGALNLAGMQGWTAIASDPVQGGVSVIPFPNGQWRLAARGADDRLRIAMINPASLPASIASGAWFVTETVVRSEPDCRAAPNSVNEIIACAHLGDGGSASVVFLNVGYNNQYQVLNTFSLGGQGAGARPTLLASPLYVEGGDSAAGAAVGFRTIRFELLVWDGNLRSFRLLRHTREIGPVPLGQYVPNYGAPVSLSPNVPDQWTLMALAYPTPFGCSNDSQCAIGGLNNAIRIVDVTAGQGSDGFAQAPAQQYVLPPVPGGLSRNVAPALVGAQVVVRGSNGRIYRASFGSEGTGTWSDEGGSTRDGSGISCAARQGGPVCFVQGTDGRIYWRVMG